MRQREYRHLARDWEILHALAATTPSPKSKAILKMALALMEIELNTYDGPVTTNHVSQGVERAGRMRKVTDTWEEGGKDADTQ